MLIGFQINSTGTASFTGSVGIELQPHAQLVVPGLTPIITLMGSLTLSGGGTAQLVQVQGDYAYCLVSTGGIRTLYVLNIHTPANPILLGSLALDALHYSLLG